ncbi:squalene/phytoene synthase family protein [Streptomyces chartreusis]|uniref:squalene/phytoene synthase family protein n=1 Tax=Streptomyces chartreusis TaxID=1969 RepID=UPI003825C5C5
MPLPAAARLPAHPGLARPGRHVDAAPGGRRRHRTERPSLTRPRSPPTSTGTRGHSWCAPCSPSTPGGIPDQAAAAWRHHAEAAQRIDFLADLAHDLQDGRLFLPADMLAQHDVTRQDLHWRENDEKVRALLTDLCARARASLNRAAAVIDVCPPSFATAARVILTLQHRQLDDIAAAGTDLLVRTIGYNPIAAAPAVMRALATGRTTR